MTKIQDEINRFMKSIFIRRVLILLTGTTIAQLITILISPVLTRIYTPEDFGLFAYIQAIAIPLSIVATLRIEMATLLPRKNNEAFYVFLTSMILCVCFSLLVFLFLSGYLVFSRNSSDIITVQFIITLPLMLLSYSIYSTMSEWLIRKKDFNNFTKGKILQTSTTASMQLSLSLLFKNSGLIIGQITGLILSSAFMSRKITEKHKIKNYTLRKFTYILKRYKNFPKFALPSDFINNLTNYAPTFIILTYFSAFEAGLFALTTRIISGPIGLISASFLQVFKEQAASDIRETGECINLWKKTALILLFISVVLFVPLYIFSIDLFKFVFGEEWEQSGRYTQILIPMFAGRIIASPLSYLYYLRNKQKWDLIWQSILFCLSIASFSYGVAFNSIEIALQLFAIVYSAMYAIYLLISYYLASKKFQ